MAENYPSRSQQENILALLCFDKEAAPLICSVYDVDLFESSIHRKIAEHAQHFYEEFREPVGDHLPDLMEDILNSEDDSKVRLYERVFDNLLDAQETVNRAYVLSNLRKFVREQQFKQALTNAAKEVKRSGDIDKAELIVSKGLKRTIEVFEPGLMVFKDPKAALSFLHTIDDPVKCGIDYFNNIGLGPARGELFTILAPTNRGKTWGLIYWAKYCLLKRLSVLHITLEMSEPRISRRYMQSMFAIAQRTETVNHSSFALDSKGRFKGFELMQTDRPTMRDRDIEQYLTTRLQRFEGRLRLVVKQFPMNSLTIPGMRTYLDQLERAHNFIPDVIIVDYADLMKIDTQSMRVDTGRVYKDLRGLATERNCCMATASQSNRLGEKVRLIDLSHLAEDYSKAATSDVIISYNQTKEEERYGLARLYVAKNRNEERGRTVLISQAYHMGQFALDSCLMSDGYWDYLEGK